MGMLIVMFKSFLDIDNCHVQELLGVHNKDFAFLENWWGIEI